VLLPADPDLLAELVERTIENGWTPIPLGSATKEPAPGVVWGGNATARGTDFKNIAEWYAPPGMGVRLDGILAIDIDAEDADEAGRLQALSEELFGKTVVRIGRDPRRMLFYRVPPDAEIGTWRRHGVMECLTGAGAYAVAFGIHPDTRKPYRWLNASPLDLKVNDLPVATARGVELLKLAVAGETTTLGPATPSSKPVSSPPLSRRGGLVTDGRDSKLRDIVAAEIGLRKQQGRPLIRHELVDACWHRFRGEADLTRPKGTGHGSWSKRDVERKVAYALRPSRQARIRASKAKGFWTLQRKLALKNAFEADRRLTQADVAVGWAMLEAVRDEKALSYLGSETIAKQTGHNPVTVRVSRRRLIEFGYFEEVRKGGGSGRPTVCSPNPKIVEGVLEPNSLGVLKAFSAPPAANDQFAVQITVATEELGETVASQHTRILTIVEGGTGALGTDPPGLDQPLEFGRWLRSVRRQLGLSRRALAERIGCGRSHVANVERGRDRFSVAARERLLAFLDRSIAA
jgi:hypothetical protein